MREDVADVGEECAADGRENRKSIFEIRDEETIAADRRDRSAALSVRIEEPNEREVGAVRRLRRTEIAEEIELIGAMR